MVQETRNFELRYGGDHCFDPTGSFQLYRSDNMIGAGGRLMLLPTSDKSRIEVDFGELSSTMRVIQVHGVPVVRVRRTHTGSIVGEWLAEPALHAAEPPPAGVPEPTAVSPTGKGGSNDALAEALRLASAVFGQSSSGGLRSLGSILANASEGMTRNAPVEPAPGPPPAAPAVPREAPVPPPAPVAPQPPVIPTTRICDKCANFRPYARVWERFQQELAMSSRVEAVSQGLDQLRTSEEKGKGEEARQLADLYRRGSDRWPSRPSFFSYCAAHERDAVEPTCFIAQIRNADQRCRPVRRSDGQRWNDAATDFSPRSEVPRSCTSCVHRVAAGGLGEIARVTQDLVAQSIALANMTGVKGSVESAAGLPSSIDNTLRRDAGASTVREMAQAFANRTMDSHLAVAPRFLAICGLKSDPARSRFRVCAVENTSDSCPEWTPRR